MSGEDTDRATWERRVGTTIRGKYRLDRLIGVGGMAGVYAATNISVQRPCALKLLHPSLSLIAELRARFLREGRIANTVQHTGALDVLDTDVGEDGAAFLVMELLEGASVEQMIESNGGKLDLHTAMTIANELLAVLTAAHVKGIVHRDVKPANLFVTREGRLKVLDFGIARVREGSTEVSATRTGMTMGTPAFMAPEQALGRTDEIGPHTDVWAVGATLFAMLSGEYVHDAQTAQEMMIRAGSQQARSLTTVASSVPGSIAAIIDRALAFNKDDRWPDAASMREALRQAYGAICSDPLSNPLPLQAAAGIADTVPSTPGHAAPVDVQGRRPPAAMASTGQPVSSGPRASSRGIGGFVVLGAILCLAAGTTAFLIVRSHSEPASSGRGTGLVDTSNATSVPAVSVSAPMQTSLPLPEASSSAPPPTSAASAPTTLPTQPARPPTPLTARPTSQPRPPAVQSAAATTTKPAPTRDLLAP